MKDRIVTLKDVEDAIDEILSNQKEWREAEIISEKEYDQVFITLESLKGRLFFKSKLPDTKNIA